MYLDANKSNNKILFKIKRKLSIFFRYLNIWGHSRLTVMLIPHSEKKIFNFQIANFTIIFSALVIFLLVLTSIFAIQSQKSTFQKKEILEIENVTISGKLNNFIHLTKELEYKQKELKTVLAKLITESGSAHINVDNLVFPENLNKVQSGIIQNSNTSNEELAKQYLEEIFTLDQLINKVTTLNSRLNDVQQQVNGFKNVMDGIPSIWPIFGGSGIFASSFGIRNDPFTRTPSFHSGVDILAMPGTPVRASASGVVTAAEFHSGNGLYVNVTHRYGYTTNYSHLQRYSVNVGDRVQKGQIIGYVGNTGRSTGYHLHYEVRTGTDAIDPSQFLYLDNFFR